MLDMFKGVVNSPETTITNDINNTDTIIYVLDETRVPADLPNLMTLGTGTNAETVKILSITGNAITVVRGFQGTARSWNSGTVIARNFTEYDYNALKENIEELEETKETPAGAQAKASAALAAAADYTDQEADVVNSALGVHLADNVTDSDGAHGLKVESGTWTPSIVGVTTAGAHTYSIQQGKYAKTGKVVIASAVVYLSAKDAAMVGGVRIIGLPFAQTSEPRDVANVYYRYVNIADTAKALTGYVSGSAVILEELNDNSATVALDAGAIQNASGFRITAIYIAE